MASTVPMPLRAKNCASMPFSLQIESHDSSADTSRGHRTQRTRQENAAIRGKRSACLRAAGRRLVGCQPQHPRGFQALADRKTHHSGCKSARRLGACPSPRSDPHLPPVTSRKVPVTNDASALASQRMARATSSGWPPRPIGIESLTRSTLPGSPPSACMSV